MKAAMHLAEKILAGHKEVQLLDGDDIRFVKEESPKERTSKKKTKKAEPSKVESEISKDRGQSFRTKASAQVAAKAAGYRAKDVQKAENGDGWVVAVQ